MEHNSSKLRKQVALGVGVVVFAIWAIIRSLPFHRYRGPIPYVWTETFNRTVTNYARIRPSRNVLLISGPRKSGKSRALNQLELDLTAAGHFVINIDPRPASNLTDLLRITASSIARALVTAKSRLSSSEMRDLLELQPRFTNCSSPLPIFHDAGLDKVYRGLIGPLEGFLGDNFSEAAVHTFFDTLELYASVLNPVLLVQNVDQVKSMNPAIVDAARARLSRRDQYEDYVPVLVELQNSSFRVVNQNPVFRVVRAGGMKDSHRLFVSKNKVFSGNEFNKITSVLGENAGVFARVFEDLKFDISLDDSLGRFQRRARVIVNRTMSGRTGSAARRFCHGPDKFRLRGSGDLEEFMPLIENGFLYVRKGHGVVPMNKEVVRALCSIQ